jgi:hypothetical protein
LRESREPAAKLATEEHVLEDGEPRDETRLLVDGADASLLSLLRCERADRLSEEAQLPSIRRLGAGHDLDQGRLSRSVFADERMDLAGEDLEGDIVERGDSAVAFGDTACSDSDSPEVLHVRLLFYSPDVTGVDWLT